MDALIQAFFSWQFLFFCLAIGAVVFVIRQVVEYWMENWWPLKQWKDAHKDAKLWRSLILPILPILLGQVGALLAKAYPYPEGFSSSTSGRIVFGLVAGFTSGLIVRLFRSFLSDKVNKFTNNIKLRRQGKNPDSYDYSGYSDYSDGSNYATSAEPIPQTDIPKKGQP